MTPVDATVGAGLDLLVVLGTDHHRFDRLVGWVDGWLERRPAGDATSALVQLGWSREPKIAGGVGIIAFDELQQLMRNAVVVVTHGGPATMLEARRQGKQPIVVPRDPTLGEHVDDHQQLFARRMADAGLISLCETEDGFAAAVDARMARPELFAVSPEEDAAHRRDVARAVAETGALLDELAGEHARRASKRRKSAGFPTSERRI